MNFAATLLWKLAGAAAVVALIAALWFRGQHYEQEAAAAKGLLKAAIAIGNTNAEVAKTHATLGKKIDAVATLAALRKSNIRAASDERRKEINNAPSEHDGPLAPVLRQQLERLPDAPGANAGGGDPAAGGAGRAAGGDAGPV